MGEMKCSIILPVLESYEVVRRQILYMNSLPMPDDFEVILIDDGSRPPIMGQTMVELPTPEFNFKYCYRGDFRPWTKACALNEGAKQAEGEWLWLFAIDWMITKPMIYFISNNQDDYLIIPLIKYALLDSFGKLEIVGKKKLFGSLGLCVVRKEQFERLGGYNEKFIGFYPSGDDIEFGTRYYKEYGRDHFVYGPVIYGFPNDKETEVCSWAMEDPATKHMDRPNIFYQKQFRDWKKKETDEYWRDYFDPSIEHPEKGFRKVFLTRYGLQEL